MTDGIVLMEMMKQQVYVLNIEPAEKCLVVTKHTHAFTLVTFVMYLLTVYLVMMKQCAHFMTLSVQDIVNVYFILFIVLIFLYSYQISGNFHMFLIT